MQLEGKYSFLLLSWEINKIQEMQLIQNAAKYSSKTAIVDSHGSYTYSRLLEESKKVAFQLLQSYKKPDLDGARVAFMVSPGFDYVKTQWGIWLAGGIAAPLCISYPLPSLTYVIDDTSASILVYGSEYKEILQPLLERENLIGIEISEIENIEDQDRAFPEVPLDRGAMILYTSGTTNLPKGVLTTHRIIQSQIKTLVDAWMWTQEDYTIGILPLHHVHGIINVLSCCLYAGGTIEFIHPFSAEKVLDTFVSGRVNVFMAVPTIYYKLITAYESLSKEAQELLSSQLAKFRLMVSGSAALPVSVMEKWKQISGHYLLERYGMTEIGMAISNPYEGVRKAGHIGFPLPGIDIRLVNEEELIVLPGHPGEIQVKGPCVFKEYWGKPEATAKAFTEDGWFKTGDIAEVEDGYFRILGRDSVDIIKSGGYKISALEIEEVLRKHEHIKDCGVVGIPDEEWGELVVAGLVCDHELDSHELNEWLRERMPAYKTPRKYIFLGDLPRNVMGKVTKNELKKLF